MQHVSYGPLIMSIMLIIMNIMLIMSCYTGFFNVRIGWQSLNTGPRFLFTSHPKDGLVVNLYIPHNRRMPLQAEEALGPISIPRGLYYFRLANNKMKNKFKNTATVPKSNRKNCRNKRQNRYP